MNYIGEVDERWRQGVLDGLRIAEHNCRRLLSDRREMLSRGDTQETELEGIELCAASLDKLWDRCLDGAESVVLIQRIENENRSVK